MTSPLNPYFSFHDQGPFRNKNERDLIRGMFKEVIQIHGYKVNYIPRTVVKLDELFGEDVLSRFETHFEIAVGFDNVEGYGPNGPDLISKFGMEIRDEVFLSVSALHFFEIVGKPNPKEGDLVYLPLSRSLFEIKFVEEERQFYPLGQQMTFKLRCETFAYSFENINTGTDADDVGLENLPRDIIDDIAPAEGTNPSIEQEADQSIDWSEKNPFGSYSR